MRLAREASQCNLRAIWACGIGSDAMRHHAVRGCSVAFALFISGIGFASAATCAQARPYLDLGRRNGQSATAKNHVLEAPEQQTDSWSLSEKIAAIATIVGAGLTIWCLSRKSKT
jgi:hypothetical protein